MNGISPKAVLIATVATLGLDIIGGIMLTAVLGGEFFRPDMSQQQIEAAARALAASKPFLLSSFVLGTLTTVLGGYLAARMAEVVPYWNALAFGVVGLVVSAFTARGLPLWFIVPAFLISLPAAVLGGHIAKLRPSEPK
jgi:hypothetical protein